MTTPTEQTDAPFSPFVGAVFTQMFANQAATVDALLANWRARLIAERALRMAIQRQTAELLDEDWTPSTHAIERAVFNPRADLIAEFTQQLEGEL